MARERSKTREENQAIEPRRQGQVSRMDTWPSFSPFGTMRRFFDDMDRMFEGFGLPTPERFNPWTTSEAFSPHMDVFERNGKFVISADLPGLDKDDVKVEVTEDGVIIEGERKYEHEEREDRSRADVHGVFIGGAGRALEHTRARQAPLSVSLGVLVTCGADTAASRLSWRSKLPKLPIG